MMFFDLLVLCGACLFITIWGWFIHKCFPTKLLVTPGDFLVFLAGGLLGLIALPNLVIWMLHILRIKGGDLGFLLLAAIPSGALIGATLSAYVKAALNRRGDAALGHPRKPKSAK